MLDCGAPLIVPRGRGKAFRTDSARQPSKATRFGSDATILARLRLVLVVRRARARRAALGGVR